jgi:4,5-DOPA dioxygenase extradiol
MTSTATSMPPLFVSHGAPTLAIERTPAHVFLSQLGRAYERAFGRPRAILLVSAHWETERPTASAAARPGTIHDFFGFPEALYRLSYTAPGAPDLAYRAADLLAEAGMACDIDPDRGLDHGAWVPLLLMWPDAAIPVCQFAIQHHMGPAAHVRLGRALAPLRHEGVLILGSGGAVHNVPDAMRRGPAAGPNAAPDWAVAFDAWLSDMLAQGRLDALADYRLTAPGAVLAHPRDEHLLPLLVAAGAGEGDALRLHSGFEYGSLSMAAWGFGGAAARLI